MSVELSSPLLSAGFREAQLSKLLSDAAYVRGMLAFEVALAKVEAELGIIPAEAALAIARAARTLPVDVAALRAGIERDGVPTLALVSALRQAAGSAGPYVHWGATSQDVMDSASVLQLREVMAHFERSIRSLLVELGALARTHRASVMVARTHGQHAAPATFGLKVVGWLAPLVRHLHRLSELAPRICRVQLGGAAGTLAALHPHGLCVAEGVARELGLGSASLPWHTQRDAFAELAAWAGLVAGGLGKLAQDVILLSQSEVAELAEAAPGERGGSSSMPHKNNPMLSERIVAAARMSGALVPTSLAALLQEHERGTHGWQLEWLGLPPLLELAGGALANAGELVRRLCVFPERMRENLLSNHGLALSEAAVGALAAHLPRPQAFELVKRAALRAAAERRFLIEIVQSELSSDPNFAAVVPKLDWPALADPANHIGHAQDLIDRALAEADAVLLNRQGAK